MIESLKNYPEELDFGACYISNPTIRGTEMIVPVRKLIINGVLFDKCHLLFKGMSASKRTLYEYIGEPDSNEGFKPERIIDDNTFPSVDVPPKVFGMEGVFESAEGWNAWIHWDIKALECVVQIVG
jgi:hypothetical protein